MTQKEITGIGPEAHQFGSRDWLSANDYQPGEEVSVPVRAFLGRRDAGSGKGEKKDKAAFYTVDVDNLQKEFKLTISNEIILSKEFDLNGYQELVGKLLFLKVKKYVGGNGFIVVGCKGEAKEAIHPPLTEKQKEFILDLGADLAKRQKILSLQVVIQNTFGKDANITNLSKAQGNSLIELLKEYQARP